MTTQSEVLPRELRLGAPPTMPQARSYLFKQKSTMTDYSEKSVIQINIPRLQRSYLTKDSYLQFTVQVTGTPGYVLKTAGTGDATTGTYAEYGLNQMLCCDTPGAYGFIDKIEVYDYLGSTLLESTSGHGQLMALLLDSCSSTAMEKKMNVYAGTGKKSIGLNQELDAYGAYNFTGEVPGFKVDTSTTFGPVSGIPFEYLASASGFIDSQAKGEYTAGTASTYVPENASEVVQREFSIPLLSFLGLLSPKYVPLHNGFTINISLNSRAIAMGRFQMSTATGVAEKPVALGTITSFKVRDVFFCSQVLELGPVAESMLLSSTQGNPLIVHSKAYRNFVNYIEPGTSNYRFDLNLNVASMTSILWMMRPTFNLASTNAEYCRSLSQRIRNYMTSWYFQYGSSILPQTTGIKTMTSSTYDSHNRSACGTSEAFVELMKAVRKNNNFTEDSCFTSANYHIDTQVEATLNPDTGALSNVVIKDPYSNVFTLVPGSLLTTSGTAANPNTYSDVARFACGINLELSPEHSFEVVSGLNTNGMNTSINATFAPNMISQQQQAQVDAWCEYDAFINITPGLASTVAF